VYASIRKRFKHTQVSAVSIILIMQGIQLTLLGAVSHVATLEKSLTVISDELAVLPGGLSRILGITTHLNIPSGITAHLLYTGLGMAGAGLLIMLLFRWKSGNRD
jgi:hypothetical protein